MKTFNDTSWSVDNARPTIKSGYNRLMTAFRARCQADDINYMQSGTVGQITPTQNVQFKDLSSGAPVRREKWSAGAYREGDRLGSGGKLLGVSFGLDFSFFGLRAWLVIGEDNLWRVRRGLDEEFGGSHSSDESSKTTSRSDFPLDRERNHSAL